MGYDVIIKYSKADKYSIMNKIIVVGLCLVIVVGTSIIFLVMVNQKDTSYASYEIKIEADEAVSYSLIIPIPLNSDDNQPSELVEHLALGEGYATFRVLDTIYGKGLNLSGTGSIRLQSKIMKFIPYAYLSTANSTVNISRWSGTYNVWVYCYSTSNTTIKITLNLYVWHDKDNMADQHWTSGSKPLVIGENSIEIKFGKSKP